MWQGFDSDSGTTQVRAVAPADDAPWGHASGWAQLYGQRRTVSCVVLGLEQATGLAETFNSLSDALTEAGYPWEVLMMDPMTSLRLSGLLVDWSRRPGFHRVALPAATTPASALTQALTWARGDAVLLMEALGGELSVPIPEMVSRWSDGLEVVRSRWTGIDHLRSRRRESTVLSQASSAEQVLGEEALLLDRRLVDSLLGSAASTPARP